MTLEVNGQTCFDTAIGTCAIAWGEQGIVGCQLPGVDAQATRAHMRRRFPALPDAEPPAEVLAVIADLQAMLRGEPVDLTDVRLDMRGVPPFHQKIYALARQLQPVFHCFCLSY